MLENLVILLVLLVVLMAAWIGFIYGKLMERRNMADFTRQNEVLAATAQTANQVEVAAGRAISIIQSPDADQSQIDANTDKIVAIEQQLARVRDDLNAATGSNQPTPQPLSGRQPR